MGNNKHSEKQEVEKTQQQAARNLGKRLDNMYFKDESGTDFDSAAGTHDDKRITFVTRSGDNIELYKGDTKISGEGEEGGKKAVMYTKTSRDITSDISIIKEHSTGGTMDDDIETYRYGTVNVENVASPPSSNPVVVPFEGFYKNRLDDYSESDATFYPKDYNALYFGLSDSASLNYMTPITFNAASYKNRFGDELPINGLNVLNRCAYDKIVLPIKRYDSSNTSLISEEAITLTVLVGGLMCEDISSFYYNGQYYRDADWETVRRLIYTCWPVIKCEKHIKNSDGSYSQSGQWYHVPYDMTFDHRRPIYFTTTKIPSVLKDVSYVSNENSANSASYNKEFTRCGLCIILTNKEDTCDYFFTDESQFLDPSLITSYADDYEITGNKPLKFGFYDYLKTEAKENPVKKSGTMNDVVVIKSFKPRIGLITENSYELYGGGCGNRDQNVKIHVLNQLIPLLDVNAGYNPEQSPNYICMPVSEYGVSNFFTYNIIQQGKYEK